MPGFPEVSSSSPLPDQGKVGVGVPMEPVGNYGNLDHHVTTTVSVTPTDSAEPFEIPITRVGVSYFDGHGGQP